MKLDSVRQMDFLLRRAFLLAAIVVRRWHIPRYSSSSRLDSKQKSSASLRKPFTGQSLAFLFIFLIQTLAAEEVCPPQARSPDLSKEDIADILNNLKKVKTPKLSKNERIVATFLGTPDPEVQKIIQYLNDNPSLYEEEIKKLTHLLKERYTPNPSLIIRALKDENSYVRATAAKALGNLGAKEAIPVLLEVLKDESSFVRATAAKALGNLGAKEAIPVLLEALIFPRKSGHSSYAAEFISSYSTGVL